jgi:hypothetical protein
MHLQKGMRKNLRENKLFFVSILKVTDGDETESVNQRYGFEDPHPVPYHNVTHPGH